MTNCSHSPCIRDRPLILQLKVRWRVCRFVILFAVSIPTTVTVYESVMYVPLCKTPCDYGKTAFPVVFLGRRKSNYYKLSRRDQNEQDKRENCFEAKVVVFMLGNKTILGSMVVGLKMTAMIGSQSMEWGKRYTSSCGIHLLWIKARRCWGYIFSFADLSLASACNGMWYGLYWLNVCPSVSWGIALKLPRLLSPSKIANAWSLMSENKASFWYLSPG